MDRETFEKQKEYGGEKKPSMTRRMVEQKDAVEYIGCLPIAGIFTNHQAKLRIAVALQVLLRLHSDRGTTSQIAVIPTRFAVHTAHTGNLI